MQNIMACSVLWYGRPPDIGNSRCRRLRKTGADYTCLLSAVATWAAEFYPTVFLLRNCEIYYQNFSVHYCCKQIARIFMESLLTFYIFSTTMPPSSCWRVAIFLTTMQGVRLWRRVNVFSRQSHTNPTKEDNSNHWPKQTKSSRTSSQLLKLMWNKCIGNSKLRNSHKEKR